MIKLNNIYNDDCLNILKQIDDNSIDLIVTDPPFGTFFMGKQWDKALPDKEVWKECERILKPGAFCFVMSSPRQDVLSRMIVNLEDAGFKMNFTSIYHSFANGFPKAKNVCKTIDKMNINVEYENIDKLEGWYCGYQPKPGIEVVIVCMKSLEKDNYVKQALDNGHGVTNLDACRIPFKKDEKQIEVVHKKENYLDSNVHEGYRKKNKSAYTHKTDWKREDGGRFPSNLLIQDDTLNDGIIRKSNRCDKPSDCGGNTWGGTNQTHRGPRGFDDQGSYSRYFDLDAWAEENDIVETMPFMIMPKASQKERSCDGQVKNDHVSVKPLRLMRYLLTLASRKDDIICDPFMGSGTTIAAAIESDRQYIGIELDEHYFEIAKKRIEITKELKENKTMDLFGEE